MDEFRLLDIRLQMEALISEREGMIAENRQREHRGESMAYMEDNFQINAGAFEKLRAVLRGG